MLQPLHYHWKLYSNNQLLKPRGGSLTSRANKNQKLKNFKKLEKSWAKQYKFASF